MVMMHHENDSNGTSKLVNGFKVYDHASSSFSSTNGLLKKRSRTSKVVVDTSVDGIPLKQSRMTDTMKKTRKTINRFNGVTKEELLQRQLPDHIKHGLDILIESRLSKACLNYVLSIKKSAIKIGINPGLFAAYKGHHYAGPGNHFWECVNMSGLIEKPASSENDLELLDHGIGFSTIVKRTTASSKELSSHEIREGSQNLIEKIKIFYPKIAVFNGKGIYEIFSKEVFGQKKKDVVFGRQPNLIPGTNTMIFVMPSSSARCSQFPRAQDKVRFYIELKQLRDRVNGHPPQLAAQELSSSFTHHVVNDINQLETVKLEKRDSLYGKSPRHHTSLPSPYQRASPRPTLSSPPTTPTNRSARQTTSKKVTKKSTSATAHPNLVKFLKQSEDNPGSSSTVLRSPLRHLKEVVSDEMRNERVGRWVRTQIDQDYESELPMGYEERLRAGEIPGDQAESDQGSQQSMVSVGVSGSTSTGSTSGYGSVDSHPHRARQDRVEMWVREQQYVRQQVEPRRPLQPDPDHSSFQQADRWPQRPQFFYSAAIDDALRPPVPLYSSWGGNDTISRDANISNSAVHDSPQLNIRSLIP